MYHPVVQQLTKRTRRQKGEKETKGKKQVITHQVHYIMHVDVTLSLA